MRPITQTLGGETTEGAEFHLDAGSYHIAIHMAAQTESSPAAQFGLQFHDGRGWKTAQQSVSHGAEPIARKIQADEEVAEAFKIEATLPTGVYRFTAISTTTVKITISKA